ncbi:hypothetical protein SAMN05421595_1961 [Austwickia chelonae]|uniref:Uncharacterized protein n=2 Tax=Austwickia TaxID=1184606 RepID=K6UL01_9MICO|nr:hypothetical protein AUCHE_03_00430 [Austwickia chelonae NBRC 105200]SEW31209.1 hypothetical protein SAMN05421595_1961 [Austwickia chelonae]
MRKGAASEAVDRERPAETADLFARPVHDPDAEHPRRQVRRTMALLKWLLVGSIVLQRFQVPGGIPVTLLLLLLGAALMVAWGTAVISRRATVLFLIATSSMAFLSWLAGQTQAEASMTSFLFLMMLYTPWILRVRDDLRECMTELGRFYVMLMSVFGVVGFVQLTVQFLRIWSYTDYLGQVPEAFLIPGFNSAAMLTYGSGIYRAHAFVFLEPSMLSQSCGLALIVGLALRLRLAALVGPALGLIGATSGTGMMLLGVGVTLIVLLRPRLLRPAFIALAVVGLIGMLLSPAAAPLLERSDEIGQSGSSGSLRFIDPYDQVIQGLEKDPLRVVRGAGPGTSERLLTSARGLGQAVVYTIPAKLLFEYGAFAGGLFLAFILYSMLRPLSIPLLGPSMVFMLMFLSGALLQPNTCLMAWLMLVIWRRPLPEPGAEDAPAVVDGIPHTRIGDWPAKRMPAGAGA